METNSVKNTFNGAKKSAAEMKDAVVDSFDSASEKVMDVAGDVKSDLKNGSSRLMDQIADSEIVHSASQGLERMSGEVRQMKTELSGIISDVQKDLSERAQSVDKSLKTNPYPYIAGAFGVGLVAAAGLLKRKKSETKSKPI